MDEIDTVILQMNVLSFLTKKECCLGIRKRTQKNRPIKVGLCFTRSTGLEPVASTVTGWRDNQLHQDPKRNMNLQYSFTFVNNHAKKI